MSQRPKKRLREKNKKTKNQGANPRPEKAQIPYEREAERGNPPPRHLWPKPCPPPALLPPFPPRRREPAEAGSGPSGPHLLSIPANAGNLRREGSLGGLTSLARPLSTTESSGFWWGATAPAALALSLGVPFPGPPRVAASIWLTASRVRERTSAAGRSPRCLSPSANGLLKPRNPAGSVRRLLRPLGCLSIRGKKNWRREI